MAAIKLVIWDYDGTLCDTHHTIAHSLRRSFEVHGLPMPADDAVNAVIAAGYTLHGSISHLHGLMGGQPLPEVMLEEMVMSYRRIYDDEGGQFLRLFPEVITVLDKLRAQHMPMMIASNKGVEVVRRSVAHYGIADYFQLIVGEQTGQPKKPDAALLTGYIQPHFPTIDPAQMLMVGDTPTDIEFAHAAGLASCWASYGYGDQQRCIQLKPRWRIEALPELLALI
ncbi:MAG: HAD family hydrolase [Alphaproteobacteria bacterium]